MDLNEQVTALEVKLKGQIEAINNNLSEKNEGKVKDLKNELEATLNAYKGEVTKSDSEKQKQLDTLEIEFKKLKNEGASGNKAMILSTQGHLAKSFKDQEAEIKAWKEKGFVGASMSAISMKAAGDMTFATATTGQVVDNSYVPGIFGTVRRKERVRQVLAFGQMTGDNVPYVLQTGGEGGAANVNGGGQKPQTDKDIALKTAPARKIAHFIRTSEEIINDLPALSSFLTFQGLEDLYDKEDQQLLFGSGTGTPLQLEGLTVGSGLLTAADVGLTGISNAQEVDAIIAAAGALAASEYNMNAIMIHPTSLYKIISLKATDGDYLKRINFTADGRLVVLGIPVFVSTAVTAGSFIVMDSRAGMGYQREAPSVRFYDQDADNATKNLITIVIEERLALAKPYQNAVFFDTFSDVITAIS
jgi:HK97 family phage major capsid protein